MDQFLADGWCPMEGISQNFLINNKGKILNLTYRQVQPVHYNHAGYYQARLQDDFGNSVLRVIHRLVALTFLRKPDQYAEKSFDELFVLHLDHDKRNNAATNLQWVTADELVKHQRGVREYANERRVQAKHLATGEVAAFRSVSEAARSIGIRQNLLNRHLQSEAAGRIQHDGWVFMFEGEHIQWPKVIFPPMEHLSLKRVADVIVTREGDASIQVFNSIVEAARLLELDIVGLRNHIARRGLSEPFDGYLFHSIGDFFK